MRAFVEPADHHVNPHSNHVLTLTVKTQYCNVDTLLWGNNQNESCSQEAMGSIYMQQVPSDRLHIGKVLFHVKQLAMSIGDSENCK